MHYSWISGDDHEHWVHEAFLQAIWGQALRSVLWRSGDKSSFRGTSWNGVMIMDEVWVDSWHYLGWVFRLSRTQPFTVLGTYSSFILRAVHGKGGDSWMLTIQNPFVDVGRETGWTSLLSSFTSHMSLVVWATWPGNDTLWHGLSKPHSAYGRQLWNPNMERGVSIINELFLQCGWELVSFLEAAQSQNYSGCPEPRFPGVMLAVNIPAHSTCWHQEMQIWTEEG